jgi:hypothetical protein
MGGNAVSFDWQINLGNLLTILAFIIGGLGFVWTMRSQIDSLAGRAGAMEAELKKLGDILINQGVQNERMNALDYRLAASDRDLKELEARFNRERDERRQ